MTDPQIWTLIGVFAASTFAMVGLASTTFRRVLRAEIDGLRGELLGEINSLRAEVTAEIRLLDKDISAIARRVFPDEP